MKIEIATDDISKIKADCILLELFEGVNKPTGITGTIDKIIGGIITDLMKREEITGKINEVNFIHTMGKLPARVIAIMGLGKREEFSSEKLRNVIGNVCRSIEKMNYQNIAMMVYGANIRGVRRDEAAQAIVEGIILGAYSFRTHVTKSSETKKIEQLIIVSSGSNNLQRLKQACYRGKLLAEATNMARDMVNEPANFMKPDDIVVRAEKIAKKYQLDLKVMDRQEMENAGMGALLGVAQGSAQPPKFIVLSYRGNRLSEKKIGFIGKGITFDSGGISLKSSENMKDMKGDMAGGAAVLSALGAIAQLKLKVNVLAIVAATENLPGGRALKPGDVLKAMNGKTIEVVNTDAEGRLTLADALSYAVKENCTELIDVATLTGSCQVALGDVYSGVFTNNQELADRVIEAGYKAGEYLWQMPMKEEYKEQNKSDVADIKNTGGKYGGAITAALFLAEFVDNIPWVHIDIAGTFMLDKDRGCLVKGATGVTVRTLVNLTETFTNS